ncbi:hypothetical protein ERO13_A05G057400v2 [Gossypium hirsutum]|uniref:Uncharacterized protein n=3 Tax=Gossypium TaxID=3633 RepID=A0A5J5VKR8_GOSBA|nr:hypothetical protein ES319_A05G059000v1 [Gossypium barbadense]KAG4197946.1 hypothetical protein ERO13_A05G057400v2 [Gossypium hirsutum]TYI25630.1 hypothetical protein ES332_A05G062700v1 [Gossypium tomentosum]TYJ32800.1 hypothetical protein E1A91_A05G060700v1 [Gossypium mustelinum]
MRTDNTFRYNAKRRHWRLQSSGFEVLGCCLCFVA